MVRFPSGAMHYLDQRIVQTAVGAHQPLIKWALGVRWMGLEDVRSPLSGNEVKNNWIYISAISCTFMPCTGTTLPPYFTKP